MRLLSFSTGSNTIITTACLHLSQAWCGSISSCGTGWAWNSFDIINDDDFVGGPIRVNVRACVRECTMHNFQVSSMLPFPSITRVIRRLLLVCWDPHPFSAPQEDKDQHTPLSLPPPILVLSLFLSLFLPLYPLPHGARRMGCPDRQQI